MSTISVLMRPAAACMALLPGCAFASDAEDTSPAISPVRDISPADLLRRLGNDDLVVLDVRRPEEYASGHIPKAVNVPHLRIAERLAELTAYRNRQVVVYCRSGSRSRIALETLRANGFENLLHLVGGMLEWQLASGPVVQSAETAAREPGSGHVHGASSAGKEGKTPP